MGMIDLGALAAHIIVDGTEGIKNLKDFGKEAGEAEGKSFSLAGGLKKLAAGFAIGAVIKKTADAIVGCVKAADELNSSCNTLQAQTGATDEEMAGLEQTLKNIYANNYGEDFNDIATALSEVKNQTKLTGDELQATTENAIALRDTFGYEIQESTRAADMMMKQFGITADEAFNLIAQGSQSGLDKNGNLLDSINEYSVHFAQLGLDVEDMFNVMDAGAASGVFDIDKVGDAFKEFGIRVKDGSDTTNEAFKILGLNADSVAQSFSAGGEEAQNAYWQVYEALNSIEDPVQRNIAGVNLFGTMWEDMGAEATLTAMGMSDNFNRTADTLERIKEIKYDDLGSAFEGIGRQLEVGLAIPIGEKILPMVNELANWINDHMPEILAVCDEVVNGIGGLIDFLKEVFTTFITEIQTDGTMFEAVWLACKAVFDTVVKAIQNIFAIFKAAFEGDWTACWEGIKKLFSDVWNGISEAFEKVLEALVKLMIGQVKLFYAAGKDIVTGIWNGLKEIWTKVKTWFDEKLTGLKTAVTDKIEDFKEAGKNLLEGIWNGINDKVQWLKEQVSGVVDKIKGWFTGKDGFDSHSPSRWGQKVGSWIMQGLGIGIEDNNTAVKAAQTAVNGIKTVFTTMAEQSKKSLEDTQKNIDSLTQKLSDYGSLFSTEQDEDGNTEYQINSLQSYIDKLNEYQDVIGQLKDKGISEGLFAELENMSVDDAIGFGEKLMEMTDEDFEEYQTLWEEKQQKSKQIAENFYKSEIDTLSEEFNTKLDEKLGTIKETTFGVGVGSIQRLMEGMKSEEESLYTKAQAIADKVSGIISSAIDSMNDADGSHRTGLNEVPFDGYKAILHRGEMVLTQPEADRYKNNDSGGTQTASTTVETNVTVEFTGSLAALGRVLQPVIKKEETRKGTALMGGAY